MFYRLFADRAIERMSVTRITPGDIGPNGQVM